MNVKMMTLAAGILALTVLKAEQSPLPVLNPHRVNFGLLQFDYDYLNRDSIYGGVGASMHTICRIKDKTQNFNNYSTNVEGRLGYNIAMAKDHSCIAYAGVGYSHFNMEKVDFFKDWSYLAAGIKPIFRTGPTFSIGFHAKGCYTIYQNHTMTETNSDTSSPKYGEIEVTESKDGEKRFGYELGLPLIWNLGEGKVWEIQLEPYYFKMPDMVRTNLIGSRLTFGYRF